MTVKDLLWVAMIGGLCLLSQSSRADRLDLLETYPTVEYCKQVTGMFYSGAVSKVNGHARVIKDADDRITAAIEHRLPLPKDAIWAPQWQDLNEREQEFMSRHVFMGYDSGATDEDEAAVITQKFFEACVRHRVAEKRL